MLGPKGRGRSPSTSDRTRSCNPTRPRSAPACPLLPRREGVRCRSWRTPRRSAPNRAGTRRRRERDGPDSRSSPCSHAKDHYPLRAWPKVTNASAPTRRGRVYEVAGCSGARPEVNAAGGAARTSGSVRGADEGVARDRAAVTRCAPGVSEATRAGGRSVLGPSRPVTQTPDFAGSVDPDRNPAFGRVASTSLRRMDHRPRHGEVAKLLGDPASNSPYRVVVNAARGRSGAGRRGSGHEVAVPQLLVPAESSPGTVRCFDPPRSRQTVVHAVATSEEALGR